MPDATTDEFEDARKGLGGKPPRRRLRQRVGMHIYVLPNLITTANMLCGFFAMIEAIKGEYLRAAYAIVAAAVFDLLDGRVARLTRTTSRFGAEYDSLCDLVSFGLAPGLLLYLWALAPFERFGWLAAFFFACCGALRLARFNVQAHIHEKAYFQGLPIPMAAGIVASSVLAFEELELEAGRSQWLFAMTLVLGLVMVSNFRYRSFKDLDLKQRLPFHYLVGGVAVIVAVALRPEVMLFVLFLGYALLGAIFGVLRLGRPLKERRAFAGSAGMQEDDLHEEVEEDEGDVAFERDGKARREAAPSAVPGGFRGKAPADRSEVADEDRPTFDIKRH